MKQIEFHSKFHRSFWFLMLSLGAAGSVKPSSTVVLYPGNNIQQLISGYPAGTIFSFAPGVYRGQQIIPRNGDQYIGQANAVLNGSNLVSSKFKRSGTYWVASYQTVAGSRVGSCDAQHPRCAYPEELFYDNTRLLHVASTSAVTAGTWFFDYTGGKVYLGNDPTGHTVEVSSTRSAFSGSATGVVISNLTIEKYANPTQVGVIGADAYAGGWVLQQNIIRSNHGTGARVSNGTVASGNTFSNNGQLGLAGTGTGLQISGNQITSNNADGFTGGWQGGAHFTQVSNFSFTQNQVLNNLADAVWTETDSTGATYDSNTVTGNLGAGIVYEISSSAIIRNNVVGSNAPGGCSWLWGGQIQVQNSHDVEVTGNQVTVGTSGCGNGIVLVQQNRGSTHYSTNDYVHNNVITHWGNNGASGGVEDYSTPDLFAASSNNRFNFNSYVVPDSTQGRWAWNNSYQNWPGFRAQGEEPNGSLGGGTVAVTASISASGTSGTTPLTVNFDGSGSTGCTSYAWNFGDGSTAGGVTSSHVYTAGTFTASLTVTGPGGSATATRSITVNQAAPVNQPPAVSAGAAQTIQLPNGATLAGSASDDGLPSGILTTMWSVVSGPGTVTFGNPNATSTTANFSTAGTYVLKLTASDTLLTSSATVQVTVNPAPVPPPTPTGLQASATSSTQINLSWNDSTAQQDSTILDRCTGTGCSGFAQIASLAAHTISFSDTNLTAGTSYSYRVRVCYQSLCSSPTSPVTAVTMPSGTVVIYPGTNIQSVVSANPAGTTFLLKAGTHRMQSVVPSNNDTFLGETGTIMSGAELLNPQQEGAYWVVYNQTQRGQVNGQCVAGYPRCMNPEDLYIDNRFIIPVDQLANVVPGKWYFDYSASKIYMADNPAGHVVETTVTRNAFSGSATGVTIRGLTVEKYASPAQMGAIGDQYPGDRWVVDKNEVRWNHGLGILVSNGGVVSNNYVHHNGEMGMGGHGTGVLVTSNEIAGNLIAGFDAGWEGGAAKFAQTNGLTVQNNYSHDNNGLGFWTDTDNINTTYDSNTIVNNNGGGISHEISYAATFKNNILKNNGPSSCSWLWGGQIQIQNSQNVQIYNNTIVVSATGCGNGIVLVQQSRGTGQYGPYVTINNYVHNNSITHLGNVGASGAVEDYTTPDVFAASSNNLFDYNAYHASSASQFAWAWANGYRNWSGFQSLGQEAHGTIDANLIP